MRRIQSMQGHRSKKEVQRRFHSKRTHRSTAAQGTGNLEGERKSFNFYLGILDLGVPFFFSLQFPRAVYGA